MEYAPVSGCMVIRPYAYEMWEKLQAFLDKEFKKGRFTVEECKAKVKAKEMELGLAPPPADMEPVLPVEEEVIEEPAISEEIEEIPPEEPLDEEPEEEIAPPEEDEVPVQEEEPLEDEPEEDMIPPEEEAMEELPAE